MTSEPAASDRQAPPTELRSNRQFPRSSLFRNQQFLKLLGSNLAFQSASSMASVCVIWYVYYTTHSAVAVAFVAIAESLATIVITLPAGVWVDRYNRKRLMILSGLLASVALAILTTEARFIGLFLPVALGAVILWSFAGELYRPARYSVMPTLVDSASLADANGINESGGSLSGTVTTAVAGAIIVTIGVGFGFLYGLAGYLLAAILASRMVIARSPGRGDAGTQPLSTKPGFVSDLSEGFRWLWTARGLLLMSLSALAFNFLWAAVWPFNVVYVTGPLHGTALLYGILLASYSAGYAAGNVSVGRTRGVAYAGKVWVVLYGAGSGILLVLIALYPVALPVLVSFGGVGFAVGFGGNVWLTTAQNLVPPSLRGRYFAVDALIGWLGNAPGIALGAVLVTTVGVVDLFLWAGLAMVLSSVLFGSFHSLWRLDGTARAGPSRRATRT